VQIPFAEWLPDAAALGNPGSLTIVNAVPGVTSYKPFKSLEAATDALGARPRGAFSARDKDRNVYNYAGDVDTLYEQDGDTWADVSQVGGYATADAEAWEFVQWKNKVLATNFSDDPQQITLGATNFSDLTTALKARHVAVVGDFVTFGNTFDGIDGNVPWRLRWSAYNNETDYTVSPTTGSDFRDLKSGGWIQKVVGGEFGVVVSEQSCYRQLFSGAPDWFQVHETVPGVGTYAAGTVVNVGAFTYFWAEQGIVELVNGTGVNWIGAGKFDEFVRVDLDDTYLDRISAARDARGGRVYWAYPGAGNVNGRPNRILVFDRVLRKANIIEADVELLWIAAAVGMSLEDLDTISTNVDTLGVSLDSPQFVGGARNLAAFNAAYEHGFFTGSNLAARIVTGERQLRPGRKTMLNGFRPLVDGGTMTARVGFRNRQEHDVAFSSSIAQSSSGRFPFRKNARFHRFELTITGDLWTDAIGVEVDPEHARPSSRRG
jgi:hypothetical protein